MPKDTFRIFRLTKDEIENLRVERLFFGISVEAKNRGGISRVQGKICFEVSGYDDDPRELWEIPEVKLYFKELDKISPFFLYYIANEIFAPTVRVYFKMFIDPKYFTTDDVGLPENIKRDVANFIESRLNEVESYCKKISVAEGVKVDPRETIYQTYKCLGIDIRREKLFK